jgi:hypothetical protein
MLLRRITKHVTDQNWFAVFIDFIIVVVGVFIGIQVANWNEERHRKALSEEFTTRLAQDLKSEAWEYQYLIEYYTDVHENAQRVLDDLEGRTSLSDLGLLISAYRATQYNIVIRRRATYDELVSRGDVYLIKDKFIRDTAIAIYTFPLYDTIYNSAFNSKYREFFQMSIPSKVQSALGELCGDKEVQKLDYINIVNSIDYPCEPNISPEVIEETAASIRDEALFLSYLRLREAQLKSNLASLTYYYPEVRESVLKFKGTP